MTDKISKDKVNKAGNIQSRIIEAMIAGNTEIAGGIYRLTLQCAGAAGMSETYAEAAPGQFINVYLRDRSMLLPRPLSVCFAEKERITLVYRVAGKGTAELSSYKEGGALKISTPLGRGYDIDAVFRAPEEAGPDPKAAAGPYPKTFAGPYPKTFAGPYPKAIALVAGGLGVPPMVELAKTLRARLEGGGHAKTRLICAAGFQKELFLTEELKSFCDELYIATDSGTAGFHGNVLEMMTARGIKADYYLSCGPRPMLKTLAGLCGRDNKPLQVSLEERMGCGYGACVGCTCRVKETVGGAVKIKQKKVCKDGPVFFGEEVIWDD